MRLKIRNHGLYMVGVFSYVVSTLPFLGINLLKALLLLLIVVYTLPILERLQPVMTTMKVRYTDVILIALAVIPYIFVGPSVYLLVPAGILTVTLLLYYEGNTLWGNVMGTTFIASLSLLWAIFLNNHFVLPALYWTLYIFTGAVFVEYKIPYREVKPWMVETSWMISVLLLVLMSVGHPLLMLTLLEPSTRFLSPGEKMSSMKEIVTLGRNGAKRDVLFVGLLAVLAVLSSVVNVRL